MIEDFADIMNGALQNLMSSGIVRQDCASAYPGIVQSILTVITYGIAPGKKTSVEEQMNCIQSVLAPCLTELGK